MPNLTDIINKLDQEDTRWDAIVDLRELSHPKLAETLIPYLKSENWVIRWCIAEKLGLLGNKLAIPHLFDCLSDDDFHVRKNAFNALKQFGEHAIEPAIQRLNHPNHLTNELSYDLLLSQNKAWVPRIASYIKKSNWVISNRILFVIWKIAGYDAESILLQSLNYKHTQKNAIILLSILKSRKAIPFLIFMFKYPHLKSVIFYGINIIGKSTAFPIIIRAAKTKHKDQATLIIKKIGLPILTWLNKALEKDTLSTEEYIELVTAIGLDKVGHSIRKYASLEPKFKEKIGPFFQSLPKVEEQDSDSLWSILFNKHD